MASSTKRFIAGGYEKCARMREGMDARVGEVAELLGRRICRGQVKNKEKVSNFERGE